MESHKIVGREEAHSVAEMVAGGDWVGNSEKEHKLSLPHDDLMQIVVVGD